MSSKLPPAPPQGGFQLPTSHSVQLKPVRPPPQPSQLQQQQQQNNNNIPTAISPRNEPTMVTPSSPNTFKQSPSSSPNVARKAPPPIFQLPSNSGGGGGSSASPPNTMPPPPQFSAIKKLSPSSSPILPKRIVSSPPLNGNSSNNQQTAPLPPPIVHFPPPPPQSMLNLSGGNMPPPPPPQILNLSGGNIPPPPPRILRNSDGNNQPQYTSTNSLNLSGGMIPPPSYINQNNNNNSSNTFNNSASSNVSPQLQSANSLAHLKPPPPSFPTRSTSLDPKQMSQFLKQPMSPSNHHPSGPSPPPFVSISPLKRNSIDNSIVNKRLSQDLNSMLVNRLQHGLSPPVATPFFDDKILGSAAKSAELKEKRDKEEVERKDRERIKKEKEESDKKEKKDKKGKEEQEKKDKKKKEEQEKLEKKEKKRKDEEEKKKIGGSTNSSSNKKSSEPINTNIFNNTISQIMDNQSNSVNLPYPIVLKLLTDGIINLNGPYTEGIFRITGSGTEVNRLKKQINEHDFSLDTQDPHVLAGLLKLWLRELTNPIIPSELYNNCIKSRSIDEDLRIVSQIPDQNKETLNYLLAFLKKVSQPHFAVHSKMDLDNVSMVFSPSLLRSNTISTDLLLNSQYEKDFVKRLIENSPQ